MKVKKSQVAIFICMFLCPPLIHSVTVFAGVCYRGLNSSERDKQTFPGAFSYHNLRMEEDYQEYGRVWQKKPSIIWGFRIVVGPKDGFKLARKVRRSQSWWALSHPSCYCILHLWAPSITKSSVLCPWELFPRVGLKGIFVQKHLTHIVKTLSLYIWDAAESRFNKVLVHMTAMWRLLFSC